MSCGVGCRHSLDPTLLWLWCGRVATALIRPLAWEPPYAAGAAQEMAKRQRKKKEALNSLLHKVTSIRLLVFNPIRYFFITLECTLKISHLLIANFWLYF